MVSAAKKNLVELNRLLTEVEQLMSSLDSEEDVSEKVKVSREVLRSFHTSAAALGFPELERAGRALDDYLERETDSAAGEETIAVFGFALNALIEAIQDPEMREDTSSFNVEEVLEILCTTSEADDLTERAATKAPTSASPGPETASSPEKKEFEPLEEPTMTKPEDFSRMEQIVNKLGGDISLHPPEGPVEMFQLSFPADAASLKQIETLLSSADPTSIFDPQLSKEDNRLDEVLSTIKEFMMALAAGDVKGARVILLLLAKQQHQAGLYGEIGSITRELHDSLKDFVDSLDSALKGLVDDELAHSENRLERILKHTEKAANTTLDHVEAIQRRNRDDQVRIPQLKVLLGGFKVTGEAAQMRMAAIQDILDELHKSAIETREDLIQILTAQDYQDLTGQVIKKIIQLLKDMEMKLVKVISTFGFKVEFLKKKPEKEPEGPIVEHKEEALYSQDDVDSLLDEFGF